MKNSLHNISQCKLCLEYLPLGPRPIVEASIDSKIVIISQVPGTKVHNSGIAWQDQSGKRLRTWLDVDDETFYNTKNFAILPMGFCYPGKGKTGDLPPRKECAPKWHDLVWQQFNKVELVLLVGVYAQRHYLKEHAKKTLTEIVSDYKSYLPKYFPMPHPSPVNRFWRSKNPWFEELVVPDLQKKIREIL